MNYKFTGRFQWPRGGKGGACPQGQTALSPGTFSPSSATCKSREAPFIVNSRSAEAFSFSSSERRSRCSGGPQPLTVSEPGFASARELGRVLKPKYLGVFDRITGY